MNFSNVAIDNYIIHWKKQLQKYQYKADAFTRHDGIDKYEFALESEAPDLRGLYENLGTAYPSAVVFKATFVLLARLYRAFDSITVFISIFLGR